MPFPLRNLHEPLLSGTNYQLRKDNALKRLKIIIIKTEQDLLQLKINNYETNNYQIKIRLRTK